jgi:large subunit ribosomal protein L22
MIAKAETKHIRISPQKVRLVLDLIRNRDVGEAEAILRHTSKRSCESIIKILRAAVANAKTKGIDADRLYISKTLCNCGPRWKRFKAAAFGRAAPILRRTSHIKIELDLKS